jgi:hypothetical protein
VKRSSVLAAVLLATTPWPARAQTASTFVGSYRLTLAFGPGCNASLRSVSVFLTLAERNLTRGSEVSGRPSAAFEALVAELALVRTGSTVHGPFATIGGRSDREPIDTVEGHIAGPWLVLDGTVGAGSGRPSARGTAVGLLQVGRAGDDFPDTLGSCSAVDHAWSLDPV